MDAAGTRNVIISKETTPVLGPLQWGGLRVFCLRG